MEVLKQSDRGVGGDVGSSKHTKYAPMHIELHAKNAEKSSVAIESFGTPLISPFSLKTVFSNYDFERLYTATSIVRQITSLAYHLSI